MDELTQKQLQNLRAVHDLTVQNAVPPTLSQLRRCLGISSDQSILDALSILERKGYLTREIAKSRGKARSLKLSESAYIALSIAPGLSPGQSRAIASPFFLNPTQRKVSEFLSSHDPRLGRIYRGAMQTIEARFEDWIAQSAYSFREIMNSFRRFNSVRNSSHSSVRKSPTGSVAGETQAYFDPQGGIAGESAYDIWYSLFQTKFNAIAHHTNEGRVFFDKPNQYITLVAEFEEFLANVIVPTQIEVYEAIDKIVAAGPETANAERLRALSTRSAESQRYFFSKLGADWFDFLRDHKFFQSRSWAIATYFERIAPVKSGEIVDEILLIDVEDGSLDILIYLRAATKAKPRDVAKLVRKIVKDLSALNPPRGSWDYFLFDIFKILVNGSCWAEALMLADALLSISKNNKLGGHTDEYMRLYYQEEVLKEIACIDPEYSEAFIGLLCGKLFALGGYVGATYPALGVHKEKDYILEDMLISSIVKMVPKYIALQTRDNRTATTDIVDCLIGNNSSFIARRLQLFIYAQNPAYFLAAIEDAVIKSFHDNEVWGELNLLVRKVFPELTPKLREAYFEMVDQGPGKDVDRPEGYDIYWRKKRLFPILDFLTDAQWAKYKDIIGEVSGEKEDPVFRDRVMMVWQGPESPMPEEQLADMPPQRVVDYLIEWTPPTTQFFGPSRSGLGGRLRQVVLRNPAIFSAQAHVFLNDGIHPTYLYSFFSGLSEAVKNKAEINWKPVAKVCTSILDRAVSGTLPTFPQDKHDDLASNWDGVFQEVANLLQHGLDERQQKLPFNLRKQIWPIIEFVCAHPDPTPEREAKYGGSNSDPYHISINSTRGQGFHTLFAYIFWCNRHTESTTRYIPDEARKVLLEHLQRNVDRSLAIRSVYGRFFPWLFFHAQVGHINIIEDVFPADNIELRYAAWETYLTNSVFEEVYSALRAQYLQAISDLKNGLPKRKYWSDPIERLAEHMVIAYAFDFDRAKDPVHETFFRVAKAKYGGKAVSFAGRAFIQREIPDSEAKPNFSRLKRFWQWRLQLSNNPKELTNFGWWAKKDKFENKWMLERLLETAEKTEGELDGDHCVFAALAALSEQYPLLCAKILKLVAFSESAKRSQLIRLYADATKSCLIDIYRSRKKDVILVADSIIDHLTKLGLEDMRNVPEFARDKDPA